MTKIGESCGCGSETDTQSTTKKKPSNPSSLTRLAYLAGLFFLSFLLLCSLYAQDAKTNTLVVVRLVSAILNAPFTPPPPPPFYSFQPALSSISPPRVKRSELGEGVDEQRDAVARGPLAVVDRVGCCVRCVGVTFYVGVMGCGKELMIRPSFPCQSVGTTYPCRCGTTAPSAPSRRGGSLCVNVKGSDGVMTTHTHMHIHTHRPSEPFHPFLHPSIYLPIQPRKKQNKRTDELRGAGALGVLAAGHAVLHVRHGRAELALGCVGIMCGGMDGWMDTRGALKKRGGARLRAGHRTTNIPLPHIQKSYLEKLGRVGHSVRQVPCLLPRRHHRRLERLRMSHGSIVINARPWT